MGESNKHKVLVEYALRFIKDSVGEELSYFIETDINDGRPLPQLTISDVLSSDHGGEISKKSD